MSNRNKEVWSLGTVYDLTEYIKKQVENGTIVGLTGKDGCIYKHGYFVCEK